MSVPMNVRTATLMFVALAWAAGGAATEEILTAAPSAPTAGAAAQSALQVVPAEGRANGRPAPEMPPERTRYIRCWQYGRLILEQAVVGPRKVEGDTYLLKRPNDPQDLQLIDLRSGGLCLIG